MPFEARNDFLQKTPQILIVLGEYRQIPMGNVSHRQRAGVDDWKKNFKPRISQIRDGF